MKKIDQVEDSRFFNMLRSVERDYFKAFPEGYIYDEQYLYEEDFGEILSPLLSSLHYKLNNLFELINQQIKGNRYFWADRSRELIACIDISMRLLRIQPLIQIGFNINKNYYKVFKECKEFLEVSGGSTISEKMDLIEILYTTQIFYFGESISKKKVIGSSSFPLKTIGEGSYAVVYSYHDEYYDKKFAVKRANNNLEQRELERFYTEFQTMKSINSPYVIEVYNLNKEKNEYIMELADYTLLDYIEKNNQTMTIDERKYLCNQIIRVFEDFSDRDILHRDVSPKNILIKKYDNFNVIKVSDFGLVKLPDSQFTAVDTDIRGYFNDLSNLSIVGFYKYDKSFEYYALTKLLYFVITGRYKNINKFDYDGLEEFVNIGLNSDLSKRFNSIQHFKEEFRKIKF